MTLQQKRCRKKILHPSEYSKARKEALAEQGISMDDQIKIYNKEVERRFTMDTKTKEKLQLPEKESRVEEIKIQRPEKKKEIKYVIDEEEAEKDKSNYKKDEYEWFKGKDHMKYKINELTGEIEEEMEEKWFEGVYDIKSQVDKKLKKNSKKYKRKQFL